MECIIFQRETWAEPSVEGIIAPEAEAQPLRGPSATCTCETMDLSQKFAKLAN